MEWALPFVGMAIGFTVAVPLGPVNLLVIRHSLKGGYRGGLKAGAGAVLGDGLHATIAALGLSAVIDRVSAHSTSTEVIAGLVLMTIGVRVWVSRLSTSSLDAGPRSRRLAGFGPFLETLAVTVSNPLTLLTFLAVFGALGLDAIDSNGIRNLDSLLLVGFVMVGNAIWWLILSILMDRLRGRLSISALDRMNRWAGLAIAGLGTIVLLRALASPLIHL